MELYTNAQCLEKVDIVSICNDLPFFYAVHAPSDIAALRGTSKPHFKKLKEFFDEYKDK